MNMSYPPPVLTLEGIHRNGGISTLEETNYQYTSYWKVIKITNEMYVNGFKLDWKNQSRWLPLEKP